MTIDIEARLSYRGKDYVVVVPFGYEGFDLNGTGGENPWESQPWIYLWEEGNFSCDCNRSRMSGIAEDFPEMATDNGAFPCGDTIELISVTPLAKKFD